MTSLEIPDLIRPLADRVDDALAGLSTGATIRWATVTQTTPLRVRLDADVSPLPFSPATAVADLVVSERVLCGVQNRRVTVLAVAGRVPATQAEVNAGAITSRYVSPSTMRNASYRPFAEAAGVISTTSTYATVTYPVGRFTQRPILTPTVRSTVGNSVGVPWQEVGQPNATSFKIIIFTIAGAVVAGEIEWSARQMTSAAAQG